MKSGLIIAMLVASTGIAMAQSNPYGRGFGYGTGSNPSNTYVRPSINSQGTYTGGHYRTTPNSTQLDNYNTRGNYNPYTGRTGTRSPRW